MRILEDFNWELEEVLERLENMIKMEIFEVWCEDDL